MATLYVFADEAAKNAAINDGSGIYTAENTFIGLANAVNAASATEATTITVAAGTYAEDITLDEVTQASTIISEMAHPDATIIWGAQIDESIEDTIRVTVVATGLGDEKKTEKSNDLGILLGNTNDDEEDDNFGSVLKFFENN